MNDFQDLRRTDDGIVAYGLSMAERPLVDSTIIRKSFRYRILGDGIFAKVVFLCAETGLGKTHLVKDLLEDLADDGIYTRYESLKGCWTDRAARTVVRVARETRNATAQPQERKAVVFDDMPSVDECDLGKIVRAIGRMLSYNTLVIVCMLPEAEMLAEEMPSAKKLNSQDLIALYQPDAFGITSGSEVPSAGIAALLFHEAVSSASSGVGVRWDTYVNALSHLTVSHVRPTLPIEEQRLRLAMVLLGTGLTEVLSSIVPRLDSDSIEWTRRDAPLFGLDRIQGTFCCVGLCSDGVFESCMADLEPLCRKFPDTTALSARALAASGNYGRAALVCSLCDPDDYATIGTMWGVEFVCAGHVATVQRAFELRDLGYGDPDQFEEYSALALAYVCDPFSTFDERPIPDVSGADVVSSSRRRRLVELLRMSRDLDRGVLTKRRFREETEKDVTAQLLVTHIRSRMLLLSGRFGEAYALLVNNPSRIAVDSLVSALLCDDFALAQLLTGEIPNQEEQLACLRSRQVIERSGVKRLASYRGLLEPLALVLCGRADRLEGVEAVISRATRMGDTAIGAVLLLVSAVVDNRAGAFARSHVRAVQAKELLGNVRGSYLVNAARFIDALSAYGLGDERPMAAIGGSSAPSVFKDLAALYVCSGPGEEVELTKLSRSSCDHDVLWQLNVLGNDFESRSRAFRQSIPLAWSSLSRKAIRKAQAMSRDTERSGSLATPRLLPSPSQQGMARVEAMTRTEDDGKPISIRLLGGFEVRVKGKLIGAKKFGKRRARAFVTLLAACKKHSVTRHELLESIWPESDYDSGRQKIYEATSVVRTLLKDEEEVTDPFVVSRNGGSIAFDTGLVSIDVDRFERAAYAVLATEDDEKVIEYANEAIRLYTGDLVETPYDTLGNVEARRQELLSLLVDVAVVGSAAATRENMLQLSVRFARCGYDAGGLREDAAIALIEALKATGRVTEARDVYREYARNLLEATGMPPSTSMRGIASGLFPTLRDGLSGRVGKQREDVTMTC